MSYMLEIIPVNQGTVQPHTTIIEADKLYSGTSDNPSVLEQLLIWVEQQGREFHIYPTKSKEAGIIKKNGLPRYHYFIWEM